MPLYSTGTYHLAPSLVALFHEVNARWPARDHESDGWIGDASHAARASDHNPDYLHGGVVRAIDVDKDGINVDQLLAAVVRDERVWYVIWNRRICSRTHAWQWLPYNGANAHEHHVHISIRHERSAETDTGRWFKQSPPKDKPPTKPLPVTGDDDDMPWTEAQLRAMMQAEQEEYATRFWVAPTGTGTAMRQQLERIEAALADLLKGESS